MLKREWGAESNGKLPHLFVPSKTVTLIPEFAVEDLPLDRTATLVPAFTVKYLSLGRSRWSSVYHTRHWIRGSRVQTRSGSSGFFRECVCMYVYMMF